MRSVPHTLNSNCFFALTSGARADRGVFAEIGTIVVFHSLPRGSGRTWIEHEERQAQSLDMTVQDHLGDTARRRAHWGRNFLRLRFWQGFRGRQHGLEDFARCSNRPVRCRL